MVVNLKVLVIKIILHLRSSLILKYLVLIKLMNMVKQRKCLIYYSKLNVKKLEYL